MVVRDRLWRLSNPALPEDRRAELVSELMQGIWTSSPTFLKRRSPRYATRLDEIPTARA